MAMIYCPQCGAQASPQAPSCPKCGHPLAAPQPNLAQPAAQPVVNVTVQQSQIVGQSGATWNPLVAAILSFFIPGLGQLYKGQPINGIVWFVLVVLGYVCFIFPGLILHLFCVIGAAMGKR